MKPVAYCSPWVPPEWIAAHGFAPLWLRGSALGGLPPTSATESAAGVRRGVCSYVQCVIDHALVGLEAGGLVLTTVCDQMRFAAALLERDAPLPVFLLNVPSTWQTPAAAQLYFDELARLGHFLVGLGGQSPSAEKLAGVMRQFEAARAATSLAPDNSIRDGGPVRLALLGGPLIDPGRELIELIEQAGGCVALDATEGGLRTAPGDFDRARLADNPLRALADAYFDAIPDVFRRPNDLLYDWLARQVAARRVRGILLVRHVGCDLWHAEAQRLRQRSIVPVLEIDLNDDGRIAPARLLTRIEAFCEMLS